MEHAAAQQQAPQRIIKVPAPPTHPDGLYDDSDYHGGCYEWSLPRLPRLAGPAAALHWEMALWRLSGSHECGQCIGYRNGLAAPIAVLRAVRADPAAKPAELFAALYFASVASLEAGRVPQARRLWRQAMDLSTAIKDSPKGWVKPRRAMRALSLLAIRLQLDQPGWPLWGPVVPPNPRSAMPVELPPRMRKLLFRHAPWFRPALLLNSMWGRLLASVADDPEATVAIAGFIHNFVIAIINDTWNPRGLNVYRESDAWGSVRGSFCAAGPYTGQWTCSEGGTEEDDPWMVPSIEQYSVDHWIAPRIR